MVSVINLAEEVSKRDSELVTTLLQNTVERNALVAPNLSKSVILNHAQVKSPVPSSFVHKELFNVYKKECLFIFCEGFLE